MTAPVVLTRVPTAVAVTLTEKVHVAPITNVPPIRVTEFDPAIAVTVPPHDPDRPFGVETTNPAGKVSVKATPVMSAKLVTGLVMVKVSVVDPVSAIVRSEKDLEMTGGSSARAAPALVIPTPTRPNEAMAMTTAPTMNLPSRFRMSRE
ncbi:MAG TPA: hypothetical protein VG014_07865 [Acidimicrobiales bacterium]|nr:hypothetical protein [Acidimicrobiales bacterium]